jgi:hypothetical protein
MPVAGKFKFEYRIAIIYFIIGFSWIYFSDTFFDTLIKDKETLVKINIIKGSFYIVITTILLYLLVKSHMSKLLKNESLIKQRSKEIEVQNEELKIAKTKAEASDILKSAFLANMSHEIRTPMNGILGFTDLLKEPNLSEQKQQKYIEVIQKSGVRMLNIINDIVDISKIEAGLMQVDIKDTNINQQIEYIYAFFKPEAEAKGLQFLIGNTSPEIDAKVKTDREKLYAILTNLIKNAIKFTNEGSIEFGYHLKKDNGTARLEFYVKDTGVGIPTDRQEAIFERFIQADISNLKVLQGTGLGLAITKAYVEILGGKIWIKSEEGIGSTFYFTTPCDIELEEELVIKTDNVSIDEDKPTEKLKILIAEDDEPSALLISLNVEAISREIITARTGKEAVDICRNNPDLNLILMDIQMPEMNGYEAARQIRQFNKDVVIIAQSAYALSLDRQKAIDAGCNDYISKPISKDDLLALIQKYLNS